MSTIAELQERADALARRAANIRVREAEVLEEEAARLQKRIELLTRYGEDEYENDTVLFFEKRFHPGQQAYTYAALKCNGRWYLTGPKQSGLVYTWVELIEFALRGAHGQPLDLNADSTMWVATEWSQVNA